jgi:phosphate starvation-inducible PhoH-like protein
MEQSLKFNLDPDDQDRVNRLCGPTNSTLKQIEEALKIKISNRGSKFKVKGNTQNTLAAEIVLKGLYQRLEKKIDVPPEEIHLYLRQVMNQHSSTVISGDTSYEKFTLKTPKTY